MKKGWEIAVVLGILLILPLAQAQTYSGFDKFSDDVKFFFSFGDNKVKLALEIREKEVSSAIENSELGNIEKTAENLENAQSKLQTVQEKISLKTADEVKKSTEEIKNKIISKENLPEEFDDYLKEEEKTQLKAELTQKTFEYCTELAQKGYEEMLKEKVCNPDTAVPGLEKELRELKDIQIKLFVQLMLNVRSCIDDPGTCNCDEVLNVGQKAKCEKMVSLAVKCEYKEDAAACKELEAMKPVPGDSFARSFIPGFLMNLFVKKIDMIEYNISHSDGVPEECWDENDKPECEKYADLKETELDWDKYGNFIGTRRARGIKEPVPSMQESIPDCYDKENNFLKEKCGNITVIWTEDGLINYIVEKQIDEIINNFENKSEQHTIEVNGTEGQIKVNEIKEEIKEINKEIAERTFAPGTEGTGEAKEDIQTVVVVEGDGSSGDDGLKPEVKTDVAGGNGGEGLVPEVETSESSS
ncbi:MAG: hypothetical protein V1886_03805 [archaeon]